MLTSLARRLTLGRCRREASLLSSFRCLEEEDQQAMLRFAEALARKRRG